MDSKIFDMFIQDKWNGRIEIEQSILNFSTPYQVFLNEHDLMLQPSIHYTIINHIFDFEIKKKTHGLKF